jgi:transposase
MRTNYHTMNDITLYLGLDVHKDSITIAVAEPGPKGEIRLFGAITNDLHAVEKALARIRKAHPGAQLEAAYEAGPCGFGIARRLQQLKAPCLVAAPSLIPKQPGSSTVHTKRSRKTGSFDGHAAEKMAQVYQWLAQVEPEPSQSKELSACHQENDEQDRGHLRASLL